MKNLLNLVLPFDLGSHWDTSNVTTMDSTFSHLSTSTASFRAPFPNMVNIIDCSDWDTSNVTNMDKVFASVDFKGDLSDWNTSMVTTMQEAFANHSNTLPELPEFYLKTQLQSVNMGYDLSEKPSIESFIAETENSVSYFNNNTASKWDVSSVMNYSAMSSYNIKFNVDLSNWNIKPEPEPEAAQLYYYDLAAISGYTSGQIYKSDYAGISNESFILPSSSTILPIILTSLVAESVSKLSISIL